MDPLELAKFIANVIDAKLGEDISVMEVFDLTDITDYFVIANFKSSSHVKAIRDFIEMELSKKGIEPMQREIASSNWIVLDYNSVIVHLFDIENRQFYNLERLWNDANIIEYK